MKWLSWLSKIIRYGPNGKRGSKNCWLRKLRSMLSKVLHPVRQAVAHYNAALYAYTKISEEI
jgi:hypothetical protein